MMNNWENNNKSPFDSKENGLFIPAKQLSFMVAGLLLLLFASFMIGFFLGKRHNIQDFTQTMHQDSFGDEIVASLSAIDAKEEDHFDDYLPLATKKQEIGECNNPEKSSDASRYYAKLIGFGTKRAADSFVAKLSKRGITTTKVEKRTSKTTRGKMINWYQVVTSEYDDRSELEALVNQLAIEEKLKDSEIVTC